MMSALHMVAQARGVIVGVGTPCAFCLDSPFDAHPGGLAQVSEAVLALRADPSCEVLCQGCRSLLEGRPGTQPTPLRMQHVLCVDGLVTYPDRASLREVIVSPPAGPFVISWATSKKKHHILHAGLSSAAQQRWGSDDGMIRVRPADHLPVLAAVEELLMFHPRGAVLTGGYSAVAIARMGGMAWDRAEAVLVSYRGQRLLGLLCAVASKNDSPAAPLGPLFEGVDMHDPIDDTAADLLALIARSSSRRVNDGLTFWGRYLRSRVQRHGHRPLREMFSRLLDECGCASSAPPVAELLRRLDDLDAASTTAIETALRGRTALLVAMAYDRRKA